MTTDKKEIYKRIQTIFLPLLLIIIIIISLVIYRNIAVERSKEHAYEALRQSISEQLITLNTELEGRFSALNTLAECIVITGENIGNSEIILEQLRRVSELGYYDEVVFIDNSGAACSYDEELYDVSERWYYSEISDGRQAVEKIEKSQITGKGQLMFCVPIIYDEEILGAVGGTVNEADFQNLLTSETYDGEGYSFVCDSAGNIIIAPESSTSLTEDNNVISSLDENSFQEGFSVSQIKEDLQKAGSGYVFCELNGEQSYMIYCPAKINDWMFFDVVPVKETVGNVIKTVDITIISITAIALVMLLYLYTVNRRKNKLIERERADFRIAAEQSGKLLIRYDVQKNEVYRFYDPEQQFDIPKQTDNFPQNIIDAGIVNPQSMESYLKFYQAMKDGEPCGSTDVNLKKKDGSFGWYHADYTLIFNKNDKPQHAIISFFDNTEQREKELAYEKLKNIVNSMIGECEAYAEVDLTKDVIERLEGTEELEKQYKNNYDKCSISVLFDYWKRKIAGPEDLEAYQEFFTNNRLLGLYYNNNYEDSLDFRVITEENGIRWMRAKIQMIKDPGSEDIKAFILYSNIDQERREQQQLSEKALRDSLTGLLNREAVEKRITQLLEQASSEDVCAMLMMDLDDFKKVNDTLGHQQGDKTIAAVAAAISGVFRQGDVVGRMGGDEFVAFLIGKNITPALIKQKAIEVCREAQFVIEGMHVAISVGVVICHCGKASFDMLYSISDSMMYQIKNSGKGRYKIEYVDKIAEKENKQAQVMGKSDIIQLQTLLNYMDGGIVLLEIAQQIKPLYVSPSYFKATGCREQKNGLNQMDILSCIHSEDVEQFESVIRNSAERGLAIDHTYRVYCIGDIVSWRHIRAVRIPYDDTDNPVLVAIITDVTKIKQQEAQRQLTD